MFSALRIWGFTVKKGTEGDGKQPSFIGNLALHRKWHLCRFRPFSFFYPRLLTRTTLRQLRTALRQPMYTTSFQPSTLPFDRRCRRPQSVSFHLTLPRACSATAPCQPTPSVLFCRDYPTRPSCRTPVQRPLRGAVSISLLYTTGLLVAALPTQQRLSTVVNGRRALCLVVHGGFEPPPTEPKPVVLPLH